MITTFRTKALYLLLLVMCWSIAGTASIQASIQITFSDGDAFDGKDLTAGNNTVDLSAYSSGLVLTNQAFNSTAQSLNSVDNSPSNPNSLSGLGIQSSGSSAGTGDAGGQIDDLVNETEFWSFSFNRTVIFEGIGMQNLVANPADMMYLSSSAWNALSITPGDAAVAFNSGEFTLKNLGTNPDIYTLTELTAGIPLLVPAGTWITIRSGEDYVVNGEPRVAGTRITSLSLTVVPEPTTWAVWASLASAAIAIYKPWKKVNFQVA